MSDGQMYLIKISAMCTADGVDVVPSGEFICDADFSTNELPVLEALRNLQNQFTKMVLGMPDLSGHPVRPMTREEIEHGKGKYLTFTPRHWAQMTGEMVARNIADLMSPTSGTSLNEGAKDHPQYDNPRDPFASQNRMPPDFQPKSRETLEYELKAAKAELEIADGEIERLNNRVCEANELATKWMREHDKLLAGIDPRQTDHESDLSGGAR